MPILDANVILRYLLNDDPVLSSMAREAVMEGCETTPEVIAEVVYVLNGYYGVERKAIAQTLTAFLDEIELHEKNSLLYALTLFAEKSLDFVDCLLAGYHHVAGKEIKTFDKKLQRVLNKNPLSKGKD